MTRDDILDELERLSSRRDRQRLRKYRDHIDDATDFRLDLQLDMFREPRDIDVILWLLRHTGERGYTAAQAERASTLGQLMNMINGLEQEPNE